MSNILDEDTYDTTTASELRKKAEPALQQTSMMMHSN